MTDDARLPNLAVVALIFLALVGATDALGALPSIGVTVPRLGIDPDTAPFLQLEAVRGIAAAAHDRRAPWRPGHPDASGSQPVPSDC